MSTFVSPAMMALKCNPKEIEQLHPCMTPSEGGKMLSEGGIIPSRGGKTIPEDGMLTAEGGIIFFFKF